jgi:hypothetical protein
MSCYLCVVCSTAFESLSFNVKAGFEPTNWDFALLFEKPKYSVSRGLYPKIKSLTFLVSKKRPLRGSAKISAEPLWTREAADPKRGQKGLKRGQFDLVLSILVDIQNYFSDCIF